MFGYSAWVPLVLVLILAVYGLMEQEISWPEAIICVAVVAFTYALCIRAAWPFWSVLIPAIAIDAYWILKIFGGDIRIR